MKLESNFLQGSDRSSCLSRGELHSQLTTLAMPVILTLLLQASAGNINAQSPAFPCSTRTPQYCAGAVNPIGKPGDATIYPIKGLTIAIDGAIQIASRDGKVLDAGVVSNPEGGNLGAVPGLGVELRIVLLVSGVGELNLNAVVIYRCIDNILGVAMASGCIRGRGGPGSDDFARGRNIRNVGFEGSDGPGVGVLRQAAVPVIDKCWHHGLIQACLSRSKGQHSLELHHGGAVVSVRGSKCSSQRPHQR